jgi:hypothetical protein
MATGYKQDFAAWATHQAKLLREKRFHELDLENLIEEVGDIPHHMSRELEWHMESLLPAMLRWHCFEGLRNQQWQEKIGEHRTWIEGVIEDSPSLIAGIPELIEHSWLSATLDVHKSLGLNFDLMPKTCPWTVEQILSIEGYYLPDEKGWRELP